MTGVPVALCGTNPTHFEYIVEHLKPEFEVVAVFTTRESVINDLPILLSLNSSSKELADAGSSDGDSDLSVSMSSAASLPSKQIFSLALNPMDLDPGTIPISAGIFNVSACKTEGVAAVVVGDGFDEEVERLVGSYKQPRGSVTWFWMKRETGGRERAKIEVLGRRVKVALQGWIEEGSSQGENGDGLGEARYF